ncbi:MAG: hypothetical protein HYV09_32975 [Deltaproteobacteria bacterium]|nr:hypothetical protein [Deltaproteobacteria bacterium]
MKQRARRFAIGDPFPEPHGALVTLEADALGAARAARAARRARDARRGDRFPEGAHEVDALSGAFAMIAAPPPNLRELERFRR